MTEENAPETQAPAESAPADDRDSILAGMAELQNAPLSDGEVDLTQTSPPDEAAQEAAAAAEPVEDTEGSEEEEEEEEVTEEDQASEDVEAAPSELDADLSRIQQAEKRSKERFAEHISAEREALAKEREEFSAQIEEAKAIKADHEAAQRRRSTSRGRASPSLWQKPVGYTPSPWRVTQTRTQHRGHRQRVWLRPHRWRSA